MIAAAAWPRRRPEDERLLWIDPVGKSFFDSRVGALPAILNPGDLLVVNDAATVPASLDARRDDGTAFEVRLLAQEATASTRWRAVLFGVGDWRSRTEDRPAPPRLRGTSHFDLMRSLVDSKTLDRALKHADRAGYLQHEFGDSVLILGADKNRSMAHSPTRP